MTSLTSLFTSLAATRAQTRLTADDLALVPSLSLMVIALILLGAALSGAGLTLGVAGGLSLLAGVGFLAVPVRHTPA